MLLLAMFSVALRYSNECPPPEEGKMWPAGDFYYFKARDVISMYIHYTFTTIEDG